MAAIWRLIDWMPRTACSLLTLALILWLTLAPHPVGDNDLPLFPGADKLVHAIMFGFLSWMFCIDVCKMRQRPPGVCAIAVCAVSAGVIGAIIEFGQQFMGLGRSMENADLIADIAGALLAFLIILATRKRFKY